MQLKDFQHFCTGCGLCHSEQNVPMIKNDKGFAIAQLNDKDCSFCSKVCPAGPGTEEYLGYNIWGNLRKICGGYASDSALRYRASSGGILTALSIWLLESHRVDEIIQIRVSEESAIETEIVCNKSASEVKSCMGSRYSTASPLSELSKIVKSGKKYALIGRPCDILSFQKYQKLSHRYDREILYTMTFFCAGTPSRKANEKMLEALGCKVEDCMALNYRGNGWPGITRAFDDSGHEYIIKYTESWSKYLGRDLLPICRFCIDGTGAAADIACGDYWELLHGKPDFNEHEGRNLIFVRTEKGEDILFHAVADGAISLCDFIEGKNNIRLIQPAQFERVTTMLPRILAMKLMGQSIPAYRLKYLYKYSKSNTVIKHLKIFKGTISRIKKGVI